MYGGPPGMRGPPPPHRGALRGPRRGPMGRGPGGGGKRPFHLFSRTASRAERLVWSLWCLRYYILLVACL